MKNVHIIGATGHIGSYLCPKMIESGYHVVGYSRGLSEPYERFCEEYRDCLVKAERREAINRAIKAKADVICDLIPYTLEDVEYLCEKIKSLPEEQRCRLISIGSIWVYGIKNDCVLTEEDTKEAADEYGYNKKMIEEYLLAQHNEWGLKVTILHPGHICGKGWIPVGPQGNRNMDVVNRIKNGEQILLPNKGSATLHHVHSEDISRIILKVLENEKTIGESFNIVAPQPISLKEYAELLYSHYNKTPNINYVDYNTFLSHLNQEDAIVSHEHIERSPNISMKKAKEILGFHSKYTEYELIIEAITSIGG